MNRTWMIALFGVLTLVGCQNMGLDYAGAAEEAQVRPPTPLVAAVHRPASEAEDEEIIVDGRLWVPSGSPVALTTDDVRAVGSAGGRTVYARSWDQSPYDVLFTQGAGDTEGQEWRGYRPVIGGGESPGSPTR